MKHANAYIALQFILWPKVVEISTVVEVGFIYCTPLPEIKSKKFKKSQHNLPSQGRHGCEGSSRRSRGTWMIWAQYILRKITNAKYSSLAKNTCTNYFLFFSFSVSLIIKILYWHAFPGRRPTTYAKFKKLPEWINTFAKPKVWNAICHVIILRDKKISRMYFKGTFIICVKYSFVHRHMVGRITANTWARDIFFRNCLVKATNLFKIKTLHFFCVN